MNPVSVNFLSPAKATFQGRKPQAPIPPALRKAPTVTQHQDVWVVRDDLLPGGTKSRFLYQLFNTHNEVVYPSCTWGSAQVALAYCAKLMGKKVTLFVPKRQDLHPRTLNAIALGGGNPKGFKPGKRGQLVMDSPHIKVVQVPMGFLNVLEANARRYCQANPQAHYVAVGAKSELAQAEIAKVAAKVEKHHGPFDEVWCVAGSGVLANGLQQGFIHPKTRFYAVQVGMPIKNPGKAKIYQHPKKMDKPLKLETPFPTCPHYDMKAWQVCQEQKGPGKILFWNVMGPPETSA